MFLHLQAEDLDDSMIVVGKTGDPITPQGNMRGRSDVSSTPSPTLNLKKGKNLKTVLKSLDQL